MATADVECKNCAARFAAATAFCSRCGQALAVEKLTFRKLLADAARQLTETDAGFWFTLRQLTRRPGAAVQEYLRGKRKAYTKPLQFYLVLLALFFGLTELLSLDAVAIRYQITRQAGLSWFSQAFLTLLDPSAEDTSRQVLALYLIGYKYLFELAAVLVMITPLGLESRLAVGSALLLLSNGYLLWAIAGFSDTLRFWSVTRALLLLLGTGILLNILCLLIVSL